MKNVVVTGVPRADAALIADLGRCGVATVHEALGRSGFLGPGLRPIQPGSRAHGTAVTVLCWPGDNLMVHVAVEQCQPGDVLVVATTSPCSDGLLGELLATSLRTRGVRGAVIDAGVRDVAALRAMGFPVWCAAISAQGTVKATPGAVNVPVSIGGQVIRPGDAIIADDDGVLCVPASQVPGTVQGALARMEREEATRAALAEGHLGLDLYGLREQLDRLGVTYLTAARQAADDASAWDDDRPGSGGP
jgi:4-hydroxy-4-methyl-2-oxoglutarate aldolase